MAKYGFKADEVAEILIIINPFVYGYCGGTAIHPMNAAQLSIPLQRGRRSGFRLGQSCLLHARKA